MDNGIQDNRYEKLCRDLSENTQILHRRNKQRIKAGIITLFLLPFVLCFMRWITDSDKIVFLLVWIFCLFAVCSYLIGVGYLDDRIQKALANMTDGETEFDGLLADPETVKAEMREKLRARVEARARGAGQAEAAAIVDAADIANAAILPENAGTPPEEGGGG